jgi:hypothetical protein
MMALLFLLTTGAFVSVLFHKQKAALWCFTLAFIFALYMTYHHIDFGTLHISL